MIVAQTLGFINSPSLWKGEQFNIFQFVFPAVNLEDYHPNNIPQNIRFGHQMEYIFKQLIAHSQQYSVEIYNLQIQGNKRTLGEIDFILKEIARNRLIHVELTYKFYIIDPGITQINERLIGPNRRDSFLAKINKIKNIQFPLIYSDTGIRALSERGLDDKIIEQQCCFKAQLFQPYGRRTQVNDRLNNDCLVGYWMRFDDFNKAAFSHYKYYVPNKSEWVVKPHLHVTWISHDEILRKTNLYLRQESSPMIWAKRMDGTINKIFVVWW